MMISLKMRRSVAIGSITLSLLLLAMLSGCSWVAEPYDDSEMFPEQFSRSGEEQLSVQWWRLFDDPQLDILVAQAFAGNPGLLAAGARLEQADALARKAGADLLPSLNGDSTVSRNWVGQDSRWSQKSQYGVNLLASYELDLWGRLQAANQAAGLDAAASAEDLRAAAITLSAEVARTWYQLNEAWIQEEILGRQVETNRQALALITLQFRTGQAGIADVLQQRQLIETNQGDLAQVAARVELLEHQLAILIGRSPLHKMDLHRRQLPDLPPLPETGVPAEVIRSRPDVRGAWYRVLAADQRTAAAIADRFPRLSLSAGISTSAEQVQDVFDHWLNTLAANLAGPLLDGGMRRAEVERRKAVVTERLNAYRQTLLAALAEVEDALSSEFHQDAYLGSLARQLTLARQSVERIRDRYLKGATDYQRVLTAQLSYQNLQRQQATARRELLELRINLCRALSRGWDARRPAL